MIIFLDKEICYRKLVFLSTTVEEADKIKTTGLYIILGYKA